MGGCACVGSPGFGGSTRPALGSCTGGWLAWPGWARLGSPGLGGSPGLAGVVGWFDGAVACCGPGCVVAGLRSPWICGSGGADAFLGSSFGSAGLAAVL